MSRNGLNRTSKNFSLCLSPDRKYSPIKTTSSIYSPTIAKKCFNSSECICCHCFNYYSCCTCSNQCPHDDSLSSTLIQNKYTNDEEDYIDNSQSYIDDMKSQIKTKFNVGKKNYINLSINYEQKLFNDFFKKVMEVESKLEDAKIRLAINPDFNCEDAFRLFDSNNKGYLTKDDIENTLNLLGIFPTIKRLKLLMKRYDLQKNGTINYADFFDMVVPFEKEYRQKIENRKPISCCPCTSLNIFNHTTIYYLQNLFNLIIDFEKEINDDRKLLVALRLKLNDIFSLLDQKRKGYVEHDELIEYFANYGILENMRDADLLFIRLDKNRNGKIDYHEIAEELPTLY